MESIKEARESFQEKAELLDANYPKVSPFDFYRSLFPKGSFERLGHQEDAKPNGIILELTEKKDGKGFDGKHTILTDGLEQLSEVLEKPYVICSPLSYYGRSRRASHALYMHALTFDVDYVDINCLKNMLHHFSCGLSPTPTYIVNTGHGVHLYFVFKSPIALYAQVQTKIKNLKTALIPIFWNKYTSTEPNRAEALGISQGFRMVGSASKLGKDYRVCAYQLGTYATIDMLNQYAPEAKRISMDTQKSTMSLVEAKDKYPEWYERVVVRGEDARRWHVKRDLYDWFKRQIPSYARVGHRYFCMMTLAIYAQKCGVEYSELLEDTYMFQKQLNDLSSQDPFTIDEALKAIEVYNEDCVRYPRDTLSRISGVPMQASKRNGMKQEQHLFLARSRKEDLKNIGIVIKEGRPKGSGTKQQQIIEWHKDHPEASQRDIALALGVSKTTVNKWLKGLTRD